MPTRTQNIKLGIFVIVAVTLLTFVLVVVGGLAFWKETNTYYVVSETSVVGLEEGSTVTMRGVPIGTVAAIGLDPEDYASVRVELEIDQEVPIPADAQAFIQFSGITGLKQVDISRGDLDRGVLPPGEIIPLGETTLNRIESRAMELAESAVAVLDQTEALMARLVEVSQGIDPKRVADLFGRVEVLLENLTGASEELERALTAGRGDLADALERGSHAASEIDELITQANRLLRANDRDLRESLRNLRQATREFRELSRDLRAQPSRLLRSKPPRERELP